MWEGRHDLVGRKVQIQENAGMSGNKEGAIIMEEFDTLV